MTSPRSHPNPQLYRGIPKDVQRPDLTWRALRLGCRLGLTLMWKTRTFNRHYEPTHGGVVYICNHQSFLDPMLMAHALRRPVNFMARDSLFRAPGFRQLITKLNAFPVRRGTADLGAIKEAMRRVKAGGQVVVFAEGTRTTDGRIGPLLPGVAMLSQRAADWTIPVVVDGAFECWPRTQMLPSPGRIVVQYARPIPREEARRLAPEELMHNVRRTLIEVQSDLRRRVGRTPLDYAAE